MQSTMNDKIITFEDHYNRDDNELVEKYSDAWTRNLRVVVTRSDNSDSDDISEDYVEDSNTFIHQQPEGHNKRVQIDAYDPFDEEDTEDEDDSNNKDNKLLPWNPGLNNFQDKSWSTEFNKFQEKHAPSSMLSGISSIASSSMTVCSNDATASNTISSNDTTTSTATTVTARIKISLDQQEVKKSNSKIFSSARSSKLMVMSATEGKEIHERAKHHMDIGEFEEALCLFLRILTARRNTYGSQVHESIGAALHNVAAAHLKNKQFRQALMVSTEALYSRKKTLGNDHLDVAQTLLQLGTVQLAIKDYDGGLRSLQEALRIRRCASSSQSVSSTKDAKNSNLMQIGHILSRLGLVYFEIQELLSADISFEEALSIYRSCLSKESCPHAVVAETLFNLGAVRSKRKQYSQAIAVFEEALMIQKKEYGSCHTKVLDTIDCLVYAYSKYGSNEIALNLYKKTMKDMRKSSGSFPSSDQDFHQKQVSLLCRSRILHKMSILSEKLGNISGSIDYSGEALEMQRSIYHEHDSGTDDEQHPNIIATKDTLLRLIVKQRQQVKGQKTIDKRNSCPPPVLGPASPPAVLTISNDGSLETIQNSNTLKKGRLHHLPKLLRLPSLSGSSTSAESRRRR